MALITEPGAAHADSYITVEEFRAYCENYGYSLTGKMTVDIEQACRRGTRWLDATYGARFIGLPSSPDQALEWPRKNAVWRGEPVESSIVPSRLKNAACEAAQRELSTPNSLSPDYVPAQAIKQESIGDISTTYQDAKGTIADVAPIISVVDGMLSGFISAKMTGAVFGTSMRS